MSDAPGHAYERVVTELREGILDGEIAGRLPSLRGLAERYGTTVDVARRAVDVLRGEGLVVTRHGSGTFARVFQRIVRTSPGRLARRHWGAGKAIQDADTGIRPRVVDVVVGETPAPPYVADVFGVQPGVPVLFRSRRFLVENRPVQLSTSYLPLDFVDTRLAYTDVGPGGTYARLAELGHAPAQFTEAITARAPMPDEVDRLDLGTSTGAIVFEIIRHAYTEAGRCIEVNRMVLDASAYRLEHHFAA